MVYRRWGQPLGRGLTLDSFLLTTTARRRNTAPATAASLSGRPGVRIELNDNVLRAGRDPLLGRGTKSIMGDFQRVRPGQHILKGEPPVRIRHNRRATVADADRMLLINEMMTFGN